MSPAIFRDGSDSAVEDSNVSPHGFQVAVPSPHHLHWPELDIDLAVESLRHPAKFPLESKAREVTRMARCMGAVPARLRSAATI